MIWGVAIFQDSISWVRERLHAINAAPEHENLAHSKLLLPPGTHPQKRPRLESLPESHVVNQLVELIGRGGLNVNVATTVARSAVQDGNAGKALLAMASCGKGGELEQNQERDLLKWLRGVWGFLLEPYCVQVPLEVTRYFACVRMLACGASAKAPS